MSMTQNGRLAIDDNDKPVMGGTSSANNQTIINSSFDPVTRRLLVDVGGGAGTVTSVSIVTDNGFAGTVADPTTTPAITLETTVTGMIKGDGTALLQAVANTDYQIPIALTTTGSTGAATFDGTTLNIPNYSAAVPSTITVANEATDTTCFVAFFTAASGDLQPKTNASMTFNSNTGVATFASTVLTTTDINGGTIDNVTITDATGIGVHDYGGATSFEIPNSAAPTVNADGEIAVDTSVTDFSHGIIKFYSGEEIGIVSMPIAQFTSPQNGDVVTYDATNDEFILAQPAASVTAPIIRVYTSSTTWNKPVGLAYVVVEVVGGGGGGGSNAGNSAGTGGGGGGYSKKIIVAGSLASSETVTVGTGGTANNSGNNSSFGAHCTGNGGSGGGQATTATNGGAGGSASGGDINIPGQNGKGVFYDSSNRSANGFGGSSVLGNGGTSITNTAQGGSGYGGGGAGGGGSDGNSGTGGTGSDGVVIVTEYY